MVRRAAIQAFASLSCLRLDFACRPVFTRLEFKGTGFLKSARALRSYVRMLVTEPERSKVHLRNGATSHPESLLEGGHRTKEHSHRVRRPKDDSLSDVDRRKFEAERLQLIKHIQEHIMSSGTR